jgi:hypothetical protein
MKNEQLKSFIKYCEKNSNERFWQALRNWSGNDFIYISNVLRDDIDIPAEKSAYLLDTFFKTN